MNMGLLSDQEKNKPSPDLGSDENIRKSLLDNNNDEYNNNFEIKRRVT